MILKFHYPALKNWFPKSEEIISLNHQYLKEVHFIGNSEVIEISLNSAITLSEAEQVRNFFDLIFSLFTGTKVACGQRFIITSDGKYIFIDSRNPLIHYNRELKIEASRLDFKVFKSQAKQLFEQIDAKFFLCERLIDDYLNDDLSESFNGFIAAISNLYNEKVSYQTIEQKADQILQLIPNFLLDKLEKALKQQQLYLINWKGIEDTHLKLTIQSFPSNKDWLVNVLNLILKNAGWNSNNITKTESFLANKVMVQKSIQVLKFFEGLIILQLIGLEAKDDLIESCNNYLDFLLFNRHNLAFEKATITKDEFLKVEPVFPLLKEIDD